MTDQYTWDDTDDSGDDAQGTTQDNPMKKLRDHAKALEKQLREAQKKAAELEAYRSQREAELRSQAVKTVFTSLGLDERHARFFPSDTEATPENVARFATENGLGSPTAPKDAPATPLETFQPFTPVSQGIPPSTRLTYEQYRGLLSSNPEAAVKAVAEGRVDGLYKNPVE